MLQPSSTGRPYFDRVDSVRGLGALAVAAFHFSGCVLNGTTLLPQIPWSKSGPVQNAIGRFAVWLAPGHLAVFGFFVISGFVLRLSLASGPQSIAKAAAKLTLGRVFRFVPIATAGAVAALLIGQNADAATFLANGLLLDVSLNHHLWSLQVEVVAIPAIVLLYFIERRFGPKLVAVLAVVMTGLAFATKWAVWPPLSTTLFSFALGMLVPTIGRDFAGRLNPRAATTLLFGSILAFFAASPVFGTYSRFTDIVGAYSAAAVVSLIAFRTDLNMLRILDARWLRGLGAACGSYYVLHMATVPIMIAIATCVPVEWSRSAPALVGIAVIAVWLAAILPFMMLVTKCVEEPGIAAGRWLIRRLKLTGDKPVKEPPIPLRRAA
jgi:peptidoglycan/LPS O-acetylase OafA/YrhL